MTTREKAPRFSVNVRAVTAIGLYVIGIVVALGALASSNMLAFIGGLSIMIGGALALYSSV